MTRALINATGGKALYPLMAAEGPGKRVQEPIRAHSNSVARVGWTEQGQHQIGSLANAPNRQCLPEIFGRSAQADAFGNIEESAQPYARVEGEAQHRCGSALKFPLQHGVGEIDRLAQIIERVINPVSTPLRHDADINLGERLQKYAINCLVERKGYTVYIFKRIVGAINFFCVILRRGR